MEEASQRALEFDTSVPNIARMYDYWLGGKDNFAADRAAADRQARAIPQLPWLELVDANQALVTVPARARDEISGFFGDWTLVEPGLTDIWAWRPEDATVANTSGFTRILGGVARKASSEPA